jgi:mono/diheme cytochrome c family protein
VKRIVAVLAGVVVVASCGGGGRGGDPVAAGASIFSTTCQACHGADGGGGLGSDLKTSAFVAQSTDAELVAFLEVGRGSEDPENTTGYEMPAKGGNSGLTTDDLADVVAFLRTINQG